MELHDAVRFLRIPSSPHRDNAAKMILDFCKSQAKIYISKYKNYKSHLDADDISNTIFIKIMESDRLDGLDSNQTAAYIRRMVENRIIDILRKKGVHAESARLEPPDPDFPESKPIKSPAVLDATSIMDAEFLIEHFYDCLERIRKISNEMELRIQIFTDYYMIPPKANLENESVKLEGISMDEMIRKHFHVTREQPEEWKKRQALISQWMHRVREFFLNCFDEKYQKGELLAEERNELRRCIDLLKKKLNTVRKAD